MKTMNSFSFLKSTAKQGILMGVCFCLYTLLMWLIKLDTTYLAIGQYFDMGIILLPIFMISWAIHQENRIYDISILGRIRVAVYISLISFLIYDPFLWFYHHVINPQWFDAVVRLKDFELKSANIDPRVIAEHLQAMRNSGTARAGLFRLSAMIPSIIVLPLVVSLLTLVFIRRRKKTDLAS
jgi:hypothetical protein